MKSLVRLDLKNNEHSKIQNYHKLPDLFILTSNKFMNVSGILKKFI